MLQKKTLPEEDNFENVIVEEKDGVKIVDGKWLCPYPLCSKGYSEKQALKSHCKKVHNDTSLIKEGKRGAPKSNNKIIDESIKANKKEVREQQKVGTVIIHELCKGIVIPPKGNPEVRDLMIQLGKKAIKNKNKFSFDVKAFSEENKDLICKLEKIKEEQIQSNKKITDFAAQIGYDQNNDEEKNKEEEKEIVITSKLKEKKTDDLMEFLLDYNISNDALEKLSSEGIDGSSFLLFTHPTLKDLEIKMNDRLKIMKLIEENSK